MNFTIYRCFPGVSDSKESACNAGDPGSIPGLERFPWGWDRLPTPVFLGFPGGSDNKESACNAETWIQSLGWEDPLEEEVGYPLQYSWASLVAQLVKNLPAMGETWIESLGWKDPLEKGKATHSSILAWRIALTI